MLPLAAPMKARRRTSSCRAIVEVLMIRGLKVFWLVCVVGSLLKVCSQGQCCQNTRKLRISCEF